MEQPRKPWMEYAKHSMKGSPKEGRGIEYYSAALGTDFSDFAGKRILEIGAGEQLLFARGLEKRGISADSVISFSPAFAEHRWSHQAREPQKDTSARLMAAGYGEFMPFRNSSFDRIVCLNVLQHLTYEGAFSDILKEIARVLDNEGVAYLSPVNVREEPGGNAILMSTYINPDELGTARISVSEIRKLLNSNIEVALNERPRMDLHDGDKYYTLILKKGSKQET